MVTKNHSSSNNNNNEWEAGDWESDLKALESAVALCNASTDLAQKERLDLLDYFALQRRDLIPDVIHFIIRPIVMAWALVLASTTTSNHCGTIRTLSRLLMVVSNVHFWTMCLFIPTFHNILMKGKPLQRRRKNEWEMEYIDPRDDTSHSPRCLLENWALSYTPMALFGVAIALVYRMPSHKIIPFAIKHGFKDAIPLAWMLAQLLTRLGSVASMHQFPKYVYDLQRERIRGPMPLLVACLCSLKMLSMSMLPIGFAADVCQLYNGVMATMRKDTSTMATMMYPWKHAMLPREKVVVSSVIILFLMTVLMAMAQLVAFQKLIRVGYFNKISLATPSHLLKDMLNDPDASRTKLRYRLNWREPKRIFSSFRRSFRRFCLFLFSGWGEDASIVSESVDTPYLLTLIKNDMDKGLYDDDRKVDWGERISEASKKMGEVHEKNYDNNSFEDPLGIAFYKTFGIGMSLDFDHDGKLNEGENPSVHRLRARAVKSAIKRYNQIPAMVDRDLEQMGESISDRIKMKRKLVEEERMRLKRDVQRLLELIPSNAPAPEGKELDVLTMRHSEVFSSGQSLLPFLENLESMDDQENSDFDPYLGDDIFGNDDNTIFS